MGAMPILGPDGEPVSVKDSVGLTLGQTGLRKYGGYIDEEFLRRLRGHRAIRIYREMSENDATIGAFLYLIETFISQVEWWVKPADVDGGQDVADFVQSALLDMETPLEDIISEALSMLPFGWAYMEKTHKFRRGPDQDDPFQNSDHNDGKIGIFSVEIRSQDSLDRWEYDPETNRLIGMWQRNELGRLVLIPVEKAVHFTTKSRKRSPEGWSFLRHSYVAWNFLKNLQEYEAIGIERDLAGYPVAFVPRALLLSDASAADKELLDSIYDMVTSIRNDSLKGLVYPSPDDPDSPNGKSGFGFELMRGGGKPAVDSSKVISRFQLDMARTVLTQFMFLGQEKGSNALSSDQTRIFAVSLGYIMGRVFKTLDAQLIKPLVKMNGWRAEQAPTLSHGDIEKQSLDILGKYAQSLHSIGVNMSAPEIHKKLLEAASLPIDAVEDNPEDLLDPPEPPQEGGSDAGTSAEGEEA